MRLVLTGRGVEITPALRHMIERKLEKLERLLNDSVVSVQVVLGEERYRRIIEIIVHARGDRTLHGEGDASTWELSLKQALEKISQQAHKLKEKRESRKRRAVGTKALPMPAMAAPVPVPAAAPARHASTREAPPRLRLETRARRVVRASRYAVKLMSVEDAAVQIESGDDTFLVFRNELTHGVSILYRRKDGHFGLIEPEA